MLDDLERHSALAKVSSGSTVDRHFGQELVRIQQALARTFRPIEINAGSVHIRESLQYLDLSSRFFANYPALNRAFERSFTMTGPNK